MRRRNKRGSGAAAGGIAHRPHGQYPPVKWRPLPYGGASAPASEHKSTNDSPAGRRERPESEERRTTV
nr:MAG TPA: hypothetical protein [Caudoviricetes sp.]